MRDAIGIAALLVGGTAFAGGSQSVVCENSSRTIEMRGGDAGSEVVIKLHGKPAPFTAKVHIKKPFESVLLTLPAPIVAVPIANHKIVSRKHRHYEVRHANGTKCEGHAEWDDRLAQRFVLMTSDAAPLADELGVKLPELTEDGYLVVDMTCHSYGMTSAAGCRVEAATDRDAMVDD
jgi:hypothetical protein